MIFRAIFWIGLVSLLMPREPDLGLGRPGGLHIPGLAAAAPALAKSALVQSPLAGSTTVCTDHAAACAGGLSMLDSFQDQAVRGLAQVKAEIEADRKERARAAAL